MLEVHVTVTAIAVFMVILTIFLFGILLYLFPVSKKLTTIPGPSVTDDKEGNIVDIVHAGSLHQYLCELHKDYGPVAAFKYGQMLVVSIADPKHFVPRQQICDIPDFLFEPWKLLIGKDSFLFALGVDSFKRKEALDFELTQTCKEHFAKVFLSFSEELNAKWRGLPEGQHIPLTQHMKGLAVKSVCQMIFGSYFEDNSKLIKLHNAWDLCWNEMIAVSKKEPNKSKSTFMKAKKGLYSLMEEAIENQWKHASNTTRTNTIVTKLLEESNNELTGEQLVSDVLTLFTVGIQSTWAILTWNFYLLMAHPKIQAKLRNELQSIKSLDIMPETISNLKYLQNVIKESIRFSSMFTCSCRMHDLSVNYEQHVIPKHTPIIEAIAVAMNLESVWENPYKFDPSRFNNETTSKLNPLKYIPFAFAANRFHPETSLVYLLTSIAIASLFGSFKLKVTNAEIDFQDCNYDSFVSMPTKEEIWAVISRNTKKNEDFETIG